jgi:hypothetical protein
MFFVYAQQKQRVLFVLWFWVNKEVKMINVKKENNKKRNCP